MNHPKNAPSEAVRNATGRQNRLTELVLDAPFAATVGVVLLLAGTAAADERVIGHPTALPEELLANPVRLDCGAIVKESRGPTLDYARLNSLCLHASSNFFTYIKAKELQLRHRRPFVWNLSFLPESSCYRCLNDEQFRFHNRFVRGRVIGYTSRADHWAFMSSIQDGEYATTFVHELFHSLSMYYGVYDNHRGSWADKTAADETLAAEFTEWLGYGR